MLNYCLSPASYPNALSKLAKWLKVLAEPNRLCIFNLLLEGVQCNCEMGENLKLPINLISHHLSVLRQAGLVNAERDPHDGRWVYYSVNTNALNELNTMFGEFFDPARIQPRRPTCGPQK
jgi:ArsR family transcriptional regulator